MDIRVLKALLDRCEDCPDGQDRQCLNENCPYHTEFQQLLRHGSVEYECDVVSYIEKGGFHGTWE